jgi:hypothetical protein
MKQSPSPAAIKKLRTLAQIAADLRKGDDFPITRLTTIKSLCADPEAAAKFALHIAQLTLKKMKSRSRPGHGTASAGTRYRRLASDIVRSMTAYMKRRSAKTRESLHELLSEAKKAQNKYEHQRWGAVRIVQCWELLIVETALECVLSPYGSSILGYQVARQYAERYNSRYGTGLLPESAPMMEEIADFWGRHYLGQGWRERLGM